MKYFLDIFILDFYTGNFLVLLHFYLIFDMGFRTRGQQANNVSKIRKHSNDLGIGENADTNSLDLSKT
jgi:hypothetical protein